MSEPIYTIKDNEVVEITKDNIRELTPTQLFNRGSKQDTQTRLDMIRGIDAVFESLDNLIERLVSKFTQFSKRFTKLKG